jgi:hypothetical protein
MQPHVLPRKKKNEVWVGTAVVFDVVYDTRGFFLAIKVHR